MLNFFLKHFKPIPIVIITMLFLGVFNFSSFLDTLLLQTPRHTTESENQKFVLQATTQDEIIADDLSQAPESVTSPTKPPLASGSIPPLTLKVRVKPEFQDTYILNKAVATAVGGVDLDIGLPGQPLPDGGVAEIATQLCTTYDVCPTENLESPPDEYWSTAQITALWNVVQKIHKSRVYREYAIGNQILEISRSACYPDVNNQPICGDETWGYFAGDNPTWGSVGRRLILITDNVPKNGLNDKLEWLIAHEIGHGASGGNENGDIPDCLACNETAKELIACDTPISSYSLNGDGSINNQEYVAEAISYYMTNAEAVNSDYLGTIGRMEDDFPCLYNAIKEGYFNGVEF